MSDRPEFSSPKSTEDLVQLYDYIYSKPDDTVHPERGKLQPYGSHTNRDGTHLGMIEVMRQREKKIPNELEVLDASCGRGHLLIALAKKGYQAHGTEVSDYLLENDLKYLPVARATYDDIHTVCGSDAFDIVITNDVLEHLVDEEMVDRALTNLCAVSRKWMCISVGILGTAATKYPTALGLEVKRLHEFCKTREWWEAYLSKYLHRVHTPAVRRAGMAFFYGVKKGYKP